MDPKLQEQIDEIERKVDAVYVSVEKTRKYMQVTAWVTVLVIVLPLIGLLFAIPAMIGTLSQSTSVLQF